MGITCTCAKRQEEVKQEVILEQGRIRDLAMMIRSDRKIFHTIIRIQARFRGLLTRRKIKQITISKMMPKQRSYYYESTTSTKITEDDVRIFFAKYLPLDDDNIELTPPVEYENKAIYYGEWSRLTNMKHGRGIQCWIDGSRYEGYWLNDKANLKGKLIHADGDVYEGEWLDDMANGFGVYLHTDGSVYEGEWYNDKQHGKGKEVWSDGAQFIGDYRNGKKSGVGTFQWSDGSVYIGEFYENLIHGKGKYTWPDGRQYDGDWKWSKMDGQGRFTWPDGRIYQGQYLNDKKHGYGVFNWQNNRMYRGQWKNGKQDGEGEFYTIKDKEWKKGIWVDGKMIDPNTESKENMTPNHQQHILQ